LPSRSYQFTRADYRAVIEKTNNDSLRTDATQRLKVLEGE
jgi:hypothetical protein